MEQVILVDDNDVEKGVMEKMQAHREGVLHRAFSVFIFNPKGEMLLQQRAINKYHSGGLWTNTCCSHPRPGEDITDAAKRRLFEEMGIETAIKKLFQFKYHVKLGSGLEEHELDHVFVGEYDGPVILNLEEVKAIQYISMQELRDQLKTEPAKFTSWFQQAFPRIDAWWKENYGNKLKSV